MQVYNAFHKIVKKHISGALIYLIVFFVILASMSLLASSDSDSSFSTSSVKFTVIDQDKTDASKALIDYLSDKHTHVRMNSYDKEALQDNLYYQEISYVLTIPEGYADKLESGDYEHLLSHSMKNDSASGYFFNQDIDAYINNLRLNLEGGCTLDEALKETAETVEVSSSDVKTITFSDTSKAGNSNMAYFFQYYSYIILSILIVSISPVLIAFHKKDLSARIICSSYSRIKQTLETGLGCVTYSLAIWLILMVLGIALYGPAQTFSSNGLLSMLNAFAYTVVAITITLLIGSFSLNTSSLSLAANIIGLGTSFLCGVFVPLWLLSKKVLVFSRFLPTYWYIKNNNMLSGFPGESFSLPAYWKNLGIQLLFAIAIFSIYLVLNKNRKKKSL